MIGWPTDCSLCALNCLVPPYNHTAPNGGGNRSLYYIMCVCPPPPKQLGMVSTLCMIMAVCI